jgi:hypothetical protein
MIKEGEKENKENVPMKIRKETLNYDKEINQSESKTIK